MTKYGILTCPGCGVTVDKNSPNMRRCKPCALKAHRQTGCGFVQRSCVVCGVAYTPTGASQKACPDCAKEFKKTQAKTARQEKLIAEGRPLKGSIQQCSACGDDFVFKSSIQHRCPECQRKYNTKRVHEWLAANPEYHKAVRKKIKDNAFFGGNRKAALERDNYTCQHCGSKNDLQVHHIDGNGTTAPKESRNNALDNLLTLCRSCHTRIHHETRRLNAAQAVRPIQQ